MTIEPKIYTVPLSFIGLDFKESIQGLIIDYKNGWEYNSFLYIFNKLSITSISLWKYTRFISRNDPTFGRMAAEIGKNDLEYKKLFPRSLWIEEKVSTTNTYNFSNGKSFISGFVEFDIDSDFQIYAELAELLRTSDFATKGFLSVSLNDQHSSLVRETEVIEKCLQNLIEYNAFGVNSQKEWEDCNKKNRERLAFIVDVFVRSDLMIVFPTINSNRDIELLFIGRKTLVDQCKNKLNIEVQPLDLDKNDWALGILQ